MLWLILTILLLAALVYWQLILAEGVYLGRRVVVWLYDLGAASYDRVKGFDDDDEGDYLARPLIERLATAANQPPADEGPKTKDEGQTPASRSSSFVLHPSSFVLRPSSFVVLDVATGTGRMPLALLLQPEFTGAIIALDASQGMLDRARAKLAAWPDRVTLLHRDATPLPFPDAHFDAVTCLEALEFLPDPHAALAEMARVLRPGGALILTLRVGADRLVFPGRVPSRAAFAADLASLGFTDIQFEIWQTYYSLVWATRSPSNAKAQRGEDAKNEA